MAMGADLEMALGIDILKVWAGTTTQQPQKGDTVWTQAGRDLCLARIQQRLTSVPDYHAVESLISGFWMLPGRGGALCTGLVLGTALGRG